jgi:hypothetical protein
VTTYAAGPLFNFPVLLDSEGDKISPLTGRELDITSAGCTDACRGRPPATFLNDPRRQGTRTNTDIVIEMPGVVCAP